MFYYYYSLLSLSYIINIHYHHYYPPPLSSLFFIILILDHRQPLSSSSFIILKFISLIFIMFIILIIINIKQDVLEARAAAENPGRRTTPHPPDKILKLQFQERSPQCAENSRKIAQSGETNNSGILCKMVST